MSKRIAHNTKLHPYKGEMLSLTELSNRGAKVSLKTIKSRLQLGWSLEDATDTPLQDTAITNATHGMRYTPEYSSWRSMKRRILNKNDPNYEFYGAKGLTIESEWVDSFEAFMAEVGKMPEPKEDYSIDRIDNSRGYHKGNVRWATLEEQARNKSNNIYEIYRGEKRLVIELAEEADMHYGTLYSRLYNRGWDIERAMKIPVQEQEQCFLFQGKLRNLVDISEMTGKAYSTLYRRVTKLKMTIDEAVKADPFPKLLINGEWLTRNQICDRYPISFVTLEKRLAEGMFPEQAVADQTELKEYNGLWLTRKELAKATGLGIDTINRRWRKGLPIDEIVKPPKRRMTKYLYKGEMRSISAIAKLNGVPHGSLSRHIRNGMSLEEALAHMGVSD